MAELTRISPKQSGHCETHPHAAAARYDAKSDSVVDRTNGTTFGFSPAVAGLEIEPAETADQSR